MISTILVANRAEIASRVFATCRRLGIGTVAVFSDADAELPYVAEADNAVRLLGTAPAETYLRGDLIIEAALKSDADAIHPGYGFLSENADFARAVEAAGLIWIGPAPESIEEMGNKVRAKALMAEAGVPVLGLDAPEESRIETPVLIKAAAGGGGRGMRVVRDAADLEAELAAASAEAESAFGDGTVFVEPYIENSRHIEVQVLGDPALGITHVLGERDCSVQRRHQKVIEEAPAPGLSDEQRTALHDAARKAADVIGYRGAGTVEFLVDASDPGRFYFLEMNTRLQVEHPVTEAVTGLDLVELQIAVAEGRGVDALVPRYSTTEGGHAIEVRLYAEDPQAGYQPQSGRLLTFEIPHDSVFETPPRHGIRLDSGFADGVEVSTHYDAMLAKVIAWAPTREQAIRQLSAALRRARVHGLRTNRDELIAILSSEDFGQMTVSTTWLETSPPEPGPSDWGAALAATAVVVADRAERRRVQPGIPEGWRNVWSQWQSETLHDSRAPEPDAHEWVVDRRGVIGFPNADFEVRSLTRDGDDWRLDWEGEGESGRFVIRLGAGLPGSRAIHVDGPRSSLTFHEVPRFTDPADAVASGSLLAPMPGSVIRVAVEVGAEVAAGNVVLVLEAMKMQHTVTAPHAGTVTEINVEPGRQVASGDLLAVVEETA